MNEETRKRMYVLGYLDALSDIKCISNLISGSNGDISYGELIERIIKLKKQIENEKTNNFK